jgi:hypothetical protein
MRHIKMGIRSEKCVRRFQHCANAKEYTYTNLDGIAYYTHYAIWYSLLLLGYKREMHVTVLNTAGNCNTMINPLTPDDL